LPNDQFGGNDDAVRIPAHHWISERAEEQRSRACAEYVDCDTHRRERRRYVACDGDVVKTDDADFTGDVDPNVSLQLSGDMGAGDFSEGRRMQRLACAEEVALHLGEGSGLLLPSGVAELLLGDAAKGEGGRFGLGDFGLYR
jgi:hypothetical protein